MEIFSQAVSHYMIYGTALVTCNQCCEEIEAQEPKAITAWCHKCEIITNVVNPLISQGGDDYEQGI